MPSDWTKGLRIAAPCPASWEAMDGNERIRHCAVCDLNVYNFAEMTQDEVRALIARSEGRVCARLYRRADGTVLTRDCPTGLRGLRRQASRVATAAVAALLSLPAFAFGGANAKATRVKIHGSKTKVTIEQVALPRPAALTGFVLIDDSPLPGTTVELRDETTGRELNFVTDANGSFTFASVPDGVYRVDLTLLGFKRASIEHLELKSNTVTHARVTMRLDPNQIVVGALALEPGHDAFSTTFTQSFIDKLPL